MGSGGSLPTSGRAISSPTLPDREPLPLRRFPAVTLGDGGDARAASDTSALGGTVTGVARVLRRERPATRIVLREPANAQLLGSGQAQERAGDGSPRGSHPAWEPHPIQGWTPDFVPLVLQEAIDDDLYDELLPVAGAEGILSSPLFETIGEDMSDEEIALSLSTPGYHIRPVDRTGAMSAVAGLEHRPKPCRPRSDRCGSGPGGSRPC